MQRGRDFADFPWLLEIAETDADRQKLLQIQEDHRRVFEEGVLPQGDTPFAIRLLGLTLWFRRASAYSSIETFTEIFKYHGHTAVPGFSGPTISYAVDLGACEGYYTLKLLIDNPACQVVAVEPHPRTFEILLRNLQSNFPGRVKVLQVAVGGTSGQRTLEYVPNIPEISSFHLERPWLPAEWIQRCSVPVLSLSDLFLQHVPWPRVDVLKMDIEGAEGEVLESGQPVLHRVRRLVLEYHGQENRERVLTLLSPRFECIREVLGPAGSPFGDLYFVQKGL